MKLQRLSICPCGYSVLDDRIEVGQEYIITSGVMPDFVYVCGNCKLEQRISIVYASQVLHPDKPPMPLPYDLFREKL